MSILIDEALKCGIITERVYNIIPKKCHCGAKLEMSESLREIRCSDKKCKIKLAKRIENMCKRLKIHITFDSILDIIDVADIESPYQILMIDKLKGRNIPDIARIANEISQALELEYYVCDIIAACGIPDIANVADKLAHGFNSVEEFFSEVENSQLTFICERLSLNTNELSKLGIKIYNEIIGIRDEIVFAEYLFNLRKYKNRLKIAFAGTPVEYLNISEFIEDIERKTEYSVCHLATISEDTNILVKSLSSDGVKERMARLINDKFAAEQVNSGKYDIDSIGKEDSSSIELIGYKIYIDSPLNVINKLQKLSEVNE